MKLMIYKQKWEELSKLLSQPQKNLTEKFKIKIEKFKKWKDNYKNFRALLEKKKQLSNNGNKNVEDLNNRFNNSNQNFKTRSQ